MGATIKNLALVLGLATIAFAGYYLYVQRGSQVLDTSANDALLAEMLANTSVFIEHSQELNQMNFDMSLYEDERFRSLRGFTTPPKEEPVGRSDPFAPVGAPTLTSDEPSS